MGRARTGAGDRCGSLSRSRASIRAARVPLQYIGAVPEPPQLPNRAPLLLVLVLSLAAWSGSIVRGGFSYDDREVLDGNGVITGSLPWTAAFDRDYWHHDVAAGHWRPAATLSLRLDHALWGDVARGYHATNVLLHLLALGLAFATLRAIGFPARAAALGLLPLALHPLLADSVAWISGRTSMLSALGGLLGCLLVAREARGRARPAVCAGAAFLGVALAVLGKEDGVVFAPLLVVLAACAGLRAGLAAGAGAGVAALAWLAVRQAVLGAALFAPHAVLAGEPLGSRMLVGGAALVQGLLLTVVPLHYPPGYRVSALAPASAAELAVAALAWVGLAAVTGVAAWTLLRRRPRALAAAAVLAVVGAVLPCMQLVPIAEPLAPRFAYLPLLFGAPLAAQLLTPLLRRARGRVALAVLVLAAVAACWQRAGVYADRESYWTARLPFERQHPNAWNALGNARQERGDRQGARAAWLQAVAVDAGYSRAWVNLGTLALELGDDAEAERALREAVRVGARNPKAFANLGVLFLRTRRPAQAELAYRRATELAPGLTAAWRGLGRAHAEQADYAAARVALDRALALDPGDALTRKLLEGLP